MSTLMKRTISRFSSALAVLVALFSALIFPSQNAQPAACTAYHIVIKGDYNSFRKPHPGLLQL